ncbi:urea transporter [Streptomyces sp. NPDC048521]|uniref:urea transporter n=1 Tax=Streptomyces sp. NPDC048521 TaxID=3365566 RepID=UPI00372241E7
MLRGLAQVMFLDNAWTGAVFALALLTTDWRYAPYGLGGAALGTGTAGLLGVPHDRVRVGLEGFNSCLTDRGRSPCHGSSSVHLRKLVFSASQADPESFDLAEPAFGVPRPRALPDNIHGPSSRTSKRSRGVSASRRRRR